MFTFFEIFSKNSTNELTTCILLHIFKKFQSELVFLSLILFQLNYKAKHEGEKFKCNVPADAPEFIQHKVNAYNLSDVSTKFKETHFCALTKRKHYQCFKHWSAKGEDWDSSTGWLCFAFESYSFEPQHCIIYWHSVAPKTKEKTGLGVTCIIITIEVVT